MCGAVVLLGVTCCFAAGFFAQEHRDAKPPYAWNKPLLQPVLFGEGVISTKEYELNAVFTPDGKKLYFTKSSPGFKHMMIVESVFRNGKWTRPEVASFSGQYRDVDPFISPDGSKLYFISNRPVNGSAPRRDYDIWFVEKSSEGWSQPKNIGGPINTDSNEWYPSTTREGTLYFSSNRSGGFGGADLYRSKLGPHGYGESENLGAAVNTQYNEQDSYVSPDEGFLVFVSFRPGGQGSGDLYISFDRSGAWTRATNLGVAINSTAYDYCPSLSPDGNYFFFTSEKGFADTPLPRPIGYADFLKRLDSVNNGLGNIYQVDASVLKTAPK